MATVLAGSRPEFRSRVRLIPAAAAGAVGAAVLLVFYYSTLGLLPAASAWPSTDYSGSVLPNSVWAHRFDLAQFLGTIPFPPIPTLFTWWVGFVIWFGVLASCGVVYAILLSWALQTSDAVKGAGVGIGLCLVLLFGLTLAQGYHPAIMRNALSDTGVLMLGWTVWAPLQLLFAYGLYGATVGTVYKHLTASQQR